MTITFPIELEADPAMNVRKSARQKVACGYSTTVKSLEVNYIRRPARTPSIFVLFLRENKK